MEQRFLGRTGVRVSRLAFGTMSFGGDADAAESARLYARCRDAGINHFDTADVYSGGRSEELLGALIQGHRDEVVLATKAYFPTGPGPNDRGASRYHLTRAVEASLRRLNTDCVDVFYVHRWDDVTDLDETLRTLDDLVRAGKILYPALSNVSAWQAATALERCRARGWAPPVAIQPMYNLLKRQAESELLPFAEHAGVAVVPYSPLAAGLLTGKFADRAQAPDDARLLTNKMYRTRYGDPHDSESARLAERFVDAARETGHEPAALAVAWVASHPAVTCPLLGARSVAQLEALLPAATIELDAEERARLSALTPAPAPATDRNEESSRHNFGAR